MKFYLLILLFVFFVIVAISVYFKYYLRYVLFKDLVYICKYFKNNISFNKNNIHQLKCDVSKHISLYSRQIIFSENRNHHLFIHKRDSNIINEFFSSMGRGDVDFELNNLNYYENNFFETKSNSYEKLNTDGKMYLKLIIGLGLAVCIILI